jgi:uncharacterized membrane protein
MAKNRKIKRTRRIIQSFEARAMKKRTFPEKIADGLTSHFGSVGFLVINLFLFCAWIVVNLGAVPGIPIFDPYPFVLLITTVSLEAIVLTVIVLMSQNRANRIDNLRDELQLQVELIAEQEISKALQLLEEILKNKGVKLDDDELDKMLQSINTSYIEKKLSEQMEGKKD